MSTIPGLVDIHVLEETTTRVSSLTKSISKQVDVVESASSIAHRALAPSAQQNRNLGQYKDNVNAVVRAYAQIAAASEQVNDLQQAINTGPAKLGWQQYLNTINAASTLTAQLADRPDLRNFPSLVESAAQLKQQGLDRMVRLIKRLAGAVYEPLDGMRFVGTSDPLPRFAPEDISALAKLVSDLGNSYPETHTNTDRVILSAIDDFSTQTLAGPVQNVGNGKGKTSLQSLGMLCDDLKAVVNESLLVLYGQNPARLRSMQDSVQKVGEREMSKATSRIAPASAPTVASPGDQASQADARASAGNLSGKRPGSQPSAEARTGPSISRDKPAAPQITVGEASPGTPGGISRGAAGSASSPSSPSAPSAAPAVGWEIFDVIDSSRFGPVPDADLARYKADGLAYLRQIFPDIEKNCRQSPITSEFAVSGATMQFMKILKGSTATTKGIDIVLSEVATRAYIAKPPPQWAIKTEPSPSARAYPVSLYFSDCLDCLHASLHQVASDHLKDPTKTGVFMLTNFSALEHYITEADSIQAVQKKSEMMDAMGNIAIHKFQKLMESSFREYLTDWKKLAPILIESTVTSSGQGGGKLSNKDREAVKEKFRQFNSEFETLVTRQKKYQVTDAALRARMTREIKALIGPLYYRFYDKHISGDFTKNIDKYIKWNKQQFDQAIEF